ARLRLLTPTSPLFPYTTLFRSDLRHCLAPAGEYSNSVGLNGCIALKNAIICEVGPVELEKSIARPEACNDTEPDPAVRAPPRLCEVIVNPNDAANVRAIANDPPALTADRSGISNEGAIMPFALSIMPVSSFDPAPLAASVINPAAGIFPTTALYTLRKMDAGSFSASATKSTPSSTLSRASPARSFAFPATFLVPCHAFDAPPLMPSQMPPPAKPPCIRDAKPIPRRPAALAAKNAALSARVRKPSDTSTPSPRRIGTSWSSPSRIRDMPGNTPPRANPDGSETGGSGVVPSLFASLLKLLMRAPLMTVSTTNRIGSFALSLIPSHALPTVSFNVSKALPTFSVAVSNSGFTVSRNQVATGLMTLFLMNA